MKALLNRVPYALLGGILATVAVGMVSEGLRHLDQAQRPERPVEAPALVSQPPAYTGPAWCLEWGVGQPESCRGELPECLEEDGSGPGITCWFTDPDYGKLWLQTGDD